MNICICISNILRVLNLNFSLCLFDIGTLGPCPKDACPVSDLNIHLKRK